MILRVNYDHSRHGEAAGVQAYSIGHTTFFIVRSFRNYTVMISNLLFLFFKHICIN